MTALLDLEQARQRTTLALIAHMHAPTDDSVGVLADCMSSFLASARLVDRPDIVASALMTWGALDGEDALALAEEFEPGISVLAELPGVAAALAEMS